MQFRVDCEEWIGRKPCKLQKQQQLDNCEGCRFYRRTTQQVRLLPKKPYTRAVLESAKTVGIVRHGGLGNVLRTDAVSRGVRIVNPNARIIWMTHPRGVDLLRYAPGVTPVDMMSTPLNLDQVRSLDVVINFEAIEAVRPVIEASKCVAGFSLNEFGKFVPASRHASHLQALQIGDTLRKNSQATMQRVLLDAIGLDDIEAQYDLEIPNRIVKQAADIVGQGLTIGLNIGTSQKGRLKRWPAKRWVALVDRLNRLVPEAQILILSGHEDYDIRKEVTQLLSTRSDLQFRLLSDSLEVGVFMAVIGQLSYLVTSDTFALHVANALGTPLVGMAGPMPYQELEVHSNTKLLNSTLSCAPCYYHCVQAVEGVCMHYIGVEQVANNLLDLMQAG